MSARSLKALLVALIALWVALVAFGNLSDPRSNWNFVQHVLAMDTIFADARIRYRAIDAPALQALAYAAIIAAEVATAVVCALGSARMWRARAAGTGAFRAAKRTALAGLALGLALWLGGFMAIGGEWFGMWMSSEWNGLESSFRFVVVLLLAAIWLSQDEAGLDEADPF